MTETGSPEQPIKEQVSKKEIILPPRVAKALGRGVEQLIHPYADAISSALDSPVEDESAQKFFEGMKSGWRRVNTFIDNLQTAKEVKIVLSQDNTSIQDCKLVFSEEKDPKPSTLAAGKVTIPHYLLEKPQNGPIPFPTAFNDAMANNLSLLIGYGQIIENLSQSDTNLKAAAHIVSSGAQKINEAINPFNSAKKITMKVNRFGEVKILTKNN